MSILSSAVLLLQAKNYSGSGDWLDESGNGLDAALNGPTFKEFDTDRYLYLPISTSNKASMPPGAGMHLGDYATYTIEVDVALPDYSPAAQAYLFSNDSVSSGRAWGFSVKTDGTLAFDTFDDANSYTGTATSTAAVSITDGERCTLRIVYVGSNTYRFYQKAHGGSFVKIGNDVTDDPILDTDTTALIVVGGRNHASGAAEGDFYAARIYGDDTQTDLICDIDFADAGEPFATFTERVSGGTVTINRNTSGLVSTVVDRNMFLLTTDDYFEVDDDALLDFAETDDLTVVAVARPFTVAAGSDVIVAKKDDLTTAAGYALVRTAATADFYIADGTLDDNDATGTMVAHTLAIAAGVRNVTDDDIEAFLAAAGSGSATTDSTTATLANALPLRIGATSGTAANFWEGQVIAVGVWPLALTDAQVADAGSRLAYGISYCRFALLGAP